MARKFLTPIDLSQLELQNARIQNLSTTSINAISSPVSGQIVFDTTLHVLKIYDGTSWAYIGGSLTGAGAPGTTPTSVGSMYFDTTNYVLYVAKGTSSSAYWVYSDPRGATGDMANLSTANSAGTSIKVAPIDHVHRHTNADHGSITINSLATPTADVAFGTYKITGLGDPSSAQDAATKAYVDAARTGLDAKASARLASTANLSAPTYTATGGTSTRGQITGAPNTLDGTSLASGDRILLKDQSSGAQNGIWYVTTVGSGANGVWDRATDFDADAKVTAGAYVWVTEGSTQADTAWVLTTNDPITLGGSSGTALTWVLFSSAGSFIAGAGLTKTGNTIDVITADSSRIVVNADNIDLASVSQTNTTPSATNSFVSAVSVDTYGRVTGVATTAHSDASTSAKGVASFSSSTFDVTSGAVTVKSGGISNTQLANSSITVSAGTNISVSGSPVSLGGTVTIGLTGSVAIANGGTGATTASGARTNLSDSGSPLPQKYTTTNGTLTPSGGSVTWTITHNLGSRAVVVQIYDSSTYTPVEVDVTRTDTNTVTLSWVSASTVSSGAYTVVVVG